MRFALEAATKWMTGGVVRSVTRDKTRDATARQEIVTRRLGGFTLHSDPRSYYCWWELPSPWRADTFVAAAAALRHRRHPGGGLRRRQLPGPQRGPPRPRLSPAPTLERALTTLAGLALSSPEDRPRRVT